MDFVSYSLLIVSAICITIAALNLRLWFSEHDQWAYVALAVGCFSAAIFSWFEISLMHTNSPAEYGETVRWMHIPGAFAVLFLAVFLYLHLQAGRLWLLAIVIIARFVSVVLNFIVPVNLNFREITAVGKVVLLGESVSYPIGDLHRHHQSVVQTFDYARAGNDSQPAITESRITNLKGFHLHDFANLLN